MGKYLGPLHARIRQCVHRAEPCVLPRRRACPCALVQTSPRRSSPFTSCSASEANVDGASAATGSSLRSNSRVTIVESQGSRPRRRRISHNGRDGNLRGRQRVRVKHLKFPDEAHGTAFHIAAIHGEFSRASNVNIHSFALGAKLSRNSIRTKLAGCWAGVHSQRALPHARRTVGRSLPPLSSNTRSFDLRQLHEYFNGILDDELLVVFHGRIFLSSRSPRKLMQSRL